MASNFIIVADDVMVANQKIEEIKNGFGFESETIQYNLADEGIYALVDELTTISMFDDSKFIVAKNASHILVSKNESAFTELLRAMNNQSGNNVLILLFMEAIDGTNERYIKLKKFSSFIELRLKNIKLDDFAKEHFQKEGYIVEDAVVQLLVSYCTSLETLRMYMNQLECFCADKKKIEINDVLEMISIPLDDNIYALIDAVLVNNKKLMMKCYRDMKLKSVQASNIVSLLLNKFQEIYDVGILLKNGFNQASLAELFHISSGRAYYMVKNVKNYPASLVQKQLNLLNDLDYKIKTGQIDQNLGLELYFLN